VFRFMDESTQHEAYLQRVRKEGIKSLGISLFPHD